MCPIRFQQLLRLSKRERDRRLAELAQARQTEHLLHERQESIARALVQLEQVTRLASRPGNINLEKLRAAVPYRMELETQLETLQGRIRQQAEENQQRHQRWASANRQAQILAKRQEVHRARLQRAREREQWRQAEDSVLWKFPRC